MNRKAVVIGSGFGGLAAAIRLQSMGFRTTVLEKRDKPGGRAYVFEEAGFTFDCGPTIITAPYLIDELFRLADRKTADYVNVVPIDPFYRICFHDKRTFDYNGSEENQLTQIRKFNASDAEGYLRFVRHTDRILQKGYIELATHPFERVRDMLKIVPDLIGLDVIRNMYSFASRYFEDENLRRVFSFHSLLIGGNPFKVSAIYALIPALEKRWGVHFAMGGTGALVQALVRLFGEMGGRLELNAEVDEILVKNRRAVGARIRNGETLYADVVVSNAGFAHTYRDLVRRKHRRKHTDRKLRARRYSMSCFLLFFGFKGKVTGLQHHNIILSEKYRELLDDIFRRRILSADFSQYLHIPTITDPGLAPSGHHTAYTLIPVPHMTENIDWKTEAAPFADRVVDFLERNYIPELRKRLVVTKYFTPLDFQNELNAHLGSGWDVEPTLTQSAYFRPHNRSEDVDGLYLVGAATHPGGGIPGVLSTAKLTTDLIADSYDIRTTEPELISN